MIEGTICPACNTHLLIEIGAEIEGKMFQFQSGIKINFSEARCGRTNLRSKLKSHYAMDFISQFIYIIIETFYVFYSFF